MQNNVTKKMALTAMLACLAFCLAFSSHSPFGKTQTNGMNWYPAANSFKLQN